MDSEPTSMTVQVLAREAKCPRCGVAPCKYPFTISLEELKDGRDHTTIFASPNAAFYGG